MHIILIIGLWIALQLCGPADATELRNYTLILSGKTAGTQITTMDGPTSLSIDFEYNDRGRGPKLQTRMTLDENGLPISIQVSGHDYLKSVVDERFHRDGDTVSWKNESEQGTQQFSEKAYYMCINSSPEEVALLAKALWNIPEKKIKLLPDGEARIERIEDRTIQKGEEKKKVVHYSISGLDFLPVSVWLEEDHTFFGSLSSWFSTIRAGWETSRDELLEAQKIYADDRFTSLAKQLAKKPEGPIAFVGVSLFDSENGVMIPNQTVLVSENRILKAGPEEEIEIPEGAHRIEGKGKSLLPGLWDMHVHLGAVDGILHVAAGVTTVRDLANDIEEATTFREKYKSGSAIGPRVILAGFMDGPGPFAGPSKILVENEQQVKEAIDRYASLEYEQIKIYSSIKPELVPFILNYAHEKGLRVSGHIPAFMIAEDLLKLGLDEIQHANFLFLNFQPEAKDTRTPLRFTAVAQHAAGLDLTSANVKAFLDLLVEKNVDLDPTLNVFESLFTDRPGIMSPGLAPVAHRLPPQNRRSGLTGGLPVPEGMDQTFRNSFVAMKQMLKLAFDSGIPIVAGTDSIAGFGLHRELELYADAGIPAPNVLQMATLIPARVMKREEELGSISVGKLADLILIDGDPTLNISDIRKVQLVCKDGILYDPAELYPAVGVKP